MADTLLGWHWLNSDRRLGYNDGREATVGETIMVDVQPRLCQASLHASERAIDSLEYAPGSIACRVVLSGTIVRGTDKAAATERTVLAMADATKALGEWACDCADRALQRERERGREPDARSWAALEVKRRWLRGEAPDSELDAAWDVAWDVASAVASAAAWDAARDAAWNAAWNAAKDAARDAAWHAEREWQNARLTELLLVLLGLDRRDNEVAAG